MKRIYFSLIMILYVLITWCCTKDMGGTTKTSSSTGQGGSMARFTIAGNYLYTVDKQSLKVYSIANGANPVLKNTVPVGFEIETIFPFKDKLFIGSTTVVHIFSIQNPENPQKLSEAISPQVLRRCDPVVAKDTVAYATLRASGPCGGFQSLLVAYDIKDVLHPVQKFTIPVTEPYGLGYAGDVLYVCDYQYGLKVFDISNAFEPKLMDTLSDGNYLDVIPYGHTLICWTTEGMVLYDISDRPHPQLITKIS